MINHHLYKIGQFLALGCPLRLAYALAVFFSDVHYIFADKDRAFLKANLEAIFPQKSWKEIRRIRISIARNFAKYLVDFFRYQKIDREYIKQNITIENIHYYREALERGKGVVVLTAHLGNWELGGVVIAQLGYPLWVVALEHKSKKVNDFFNAQRESKGIKVIPFSKAARMCFQLLKKNELVALVGDRDFTKEGGIVIDFFGKPTSLPKGPAALALKTGATIIPGFMVRNPDDSFTLKIEKPILAGDCPADTAEYEQRLIGLMNEYKVVFEQFIRQYPDQWYMFRQFWLEK